MKLKTFLGAMAAALFLLGAVHGTADAHSTPTKVGDLTITEIWARPTAPNAKTGAVYFLIENRGNTDDALIAVTGSVSGKVEIHHSKVEGGVMQMREVDRIGITAQGVTTLEPGGFHIMLRDLLAPIKAGDHFPLTLTFEKSGTVEITVTGMKPPKAQDSEKMDHGEMKHGKKAAH